MKKISAFDIISFTVLGLCVIFFVSMLFVDINKYITYGVAVIFGMDIFSLIIMHKHDKMQKRIEWLENRTRLSNDISYRVKVAGENSFNHLPIGILVLNKQDSHIEWANDYARSIFHSDLNKNSALIDKRINDFNIENEGKRLEGVLAVQDDFDFLINGRNYHIHVARKDLIVYLTDITDFKELKRVYNERTIAAGIISLDNYEQAFASADAQVKATTNGEIIGLFSRWANKYGLYIRGYSEKEYLLLMDRKQLERVEADRFDLMDIFNEHCKNNNLKMTLSIAVCTYDTNKTINAENRPEEDKSDSANINNISDIMDKVKSYLKLVYDRGGNQAVVVSDEYPQPKFFGGKTIGSQAIDKTTTRRMAEDFFDRVEQSDKVIIMAHKNTDVDAFAGSLAIAKIVKAYKKEAYIVFDKKIADPTVIQLWEEIDMDHKNLVWDEYIKFVTPITATTIMTKESLLVICDVQAIDQLISERVYKKASKLCNVAVLDHHRTGEDPANQNVVYKYLDTNVSSTVELVLQLYEFLDDEIQKQLQVTSFEACMMILGILIDTTNLMFRVTANTFNVLAKLQAYGAEMSQARSYLRDKYETYVNKSQTINKIIVQKNSFDGVYGIITLDEDKIYSRTDLAKYADEIINFQDFRAGFCIGPIISIENGKEIRQIGISARSVESTNVQLIMEALGGGGHYNNAATQISDTTVEDALGALKIALDIDDTSGDNMKVILLNDVKQKGRKGDIIDVKSGYANFLIKNRDAIVATPDNINELKRQNDLEKIKAEKYLEEMREVKEKIENHDYYCAVKTGENGKVFGSVSNRNIIDEIYLKEGIVIDKKKMVISVYDSGNNLVTKNIDKLGTYDVKIQLHKEVEVNIKLHVVETK